MNLEFIKNMNSAPNFEIIGGGKITDEFLSLGLMDFHYALHYIWRLPYSRNSNRAEFNLVLKEKRGTCSTKHALLAQLAAEQEQQIFLTLGIYEMNEQNTPDVGKIFDEFDLKNLPEAHCYLTFNNERIDVTRFSNEELLKPIKDFLYEERIQPEQIGDYKINLHRTFFQNWMYEKNLSRRFNLEQLWSIREECIAALAQS